MDAQSKVCDISFTEKARIFSRDYLQCFVYIERCRNPHDIFTKRFFSKLVAAALNLEDFLDFHGAKNNRDWYFYRELAASARHISLAGNFQKHIVNRLIFYDLPDTDIFEAQGQQTLDFIIAVLVNMAPVVGDEARRLNIPLPAATLDPADYPGVSTAELLPYDIDDVTRHQQKRKVVKIASEFLAIANDFEQLGFYEAQPEAALRQMVPGKINEVEIRRYEMLLHNLQSSFDTYVIHGGFRFGNRKLKRLRSYFSIVFHLLQITGRLLHFYERHLHEAGYKDTYKRVQERLADLIDPAVLLDRTVNYGLLYAYRFLSQGKELARAIMNAHIERGAIRVGIPVKLGFHSRPSLLVAKIVQHYGGQVELVVGEDRFDASSVLDIQWAGGKIHKEGRTTVLFEGDSRALADIEVLAGVNYGEDTMGKGVPLPQELNYLR